MPTSSDQAQLVSFLLTSSRNSLDDFLLAKLNESANAERSLRDLLRAFVECLAWAHFAQLIRDHGEAIVAQLSNGAVVAPPALSPAAAPAAERRGRVRRVPRALAHSEKQRLEFSTLEWDLLEKIMADTMLPSRASVVRALVMQDAQRRGLVSGDK